MPRLTRSAPKYRKHRASGQAVVTLGGKDHYLGRYGSKHSKSEYDRLVGEWMAGGRSAAPSVHEADELTVNELLARYRLHCRQHYKPQPHARTNERDNIALALKPLRLLYGKTLARDFGPLALKSMQRHYIDSGLSRPTVNKRIDVIRRFFKWCVSEQLVPLDLAHGLAAVRNLQKGKTDAAEPAPVEPVDDAIVNATLSHLPAVVADMVRLQRLTGMRPGELLIVRPADVDRSGETWRYVPHAHKNEHRGKPRVVFIGAKGQDILRPYLLRAETAYCFDPRDSEKKRRAAIHEKRVTPLCCGNSPGTNKRRNPGRKIGKRYNTASYRHAIVRAARKANVAEWSPNQLRHTAATDIRQRYGLEAAQVLLGHSKADVTQVYAQRDFALAAKVAREVG